MYLLKPYLRILGQVSTEDLFPHWTLQHQDPRHLSGRLLQCNGLKRQKKETIIWFYSETRPHQVAQTGIQFWRFSHPRILALGLQVCYHVQLGVCVWFLFNFKVVLLMRSKISMLSTKDKSLMSHDLGFRGLKFTGQLLLLFNHISHLTTKIQELPLFNKWLFNAVYPRDYTLFTNLVTLLLCYMGRTG